jgi:hypothetical protein
MTRASPRLHHDHERPTQVVQPDDWIARWPHADERSAACHHGCRVGRRRRDLPATGASAKPRVRACRRRCPHVHLASASYECVLCVAVEDQLQVHCATSAPSTPTTWVAAPEAHQQRTCVPRSVAGRGPAAADEHSAAPRSRADLPRDDCPRVTWRRPCRVAKNTDSRGRSAQTAYRS